MILLSVLYLQLAEVDCHYVKAKVAEHGKPAAIAWAITHGYGWSDILRIRRKCKV